MSETNEIVAKVLEVKCAGQVQGDDRWPKWYPCRNAGTIKEDGKCWCKIHAPSIVKARQNARDKKWRDKWKARDDRADRLARIEQARDAVIQVLQGAMHDGNMNEDGDGFVIPLADYRQIQAELKALATQENAE